MVGCPIHTCFNHFASGDQHFPRFPTDPDTFGLYVTVDVQFLNRDMGRLYLWATYDAAVPLVKPCCILWIGNVFVWKPTTSSTLGLLVRNRLFDDHGLNIFTANHHCNVTIPLSIPLRSVRCRTAPYKGIQWNLPRGWSLWNYSVELLRVSWRVCVLWSMRCLHIESPFSDVFNQ